MTVTAETFNSTQKLKMSKSISLLQIIHLQPGFDLQTTKIAFFSYLPMKIKYNLSVMHITMN